LRSPAARQLIVDAEEEAARTGSAGVGTEHLLLGVLRDPETFTARLLEAWGLDYPAVAPPDAPGADTKAARPFTPGAKKALELALRESMQARNPLIGPEHVVVGIAVEGGAGGAILASAGLDADTLRRRLCRPEALPTFALSSGPGFRVVELEGDALEWERRLNDLAERGYVLVEIVGQRAVFRSPLGA